MRKVLLCIKKIFFHINKYSGGYLVIIGIFTIWGGSQIIILRDKVDSLEKLNIEKNLTVGGTLDVESVGSKIRGPLHIFGTSSQYGASLGDDNIIQSRGCIEFKVSGTTSWKHLTPEVSDQTNNVLWKNGRCNFDW